MQNSSVNESTGQASENLVLSNKSDSLAEIPKLIKLDILPLKTYSKTEYANEIETSSIHERTIKAADSLNGKDIISTQSNLDKVGAFEEMPNFFGHDTLPNDTIETVRSSKLFEKVLDDNNHKSVSAVKQSDNDKHKRKQQFRCLNCFRPTRGQFPCFCRLLLAVLSSRTKWSSPNRCTRG